MAEMDPWSSMPVATDGKARIGLVIDTMGGGGAERMTLNLASGLVAKGYQVDLLLCAVKGSYLASIPDSVRLFVINKGVWSKRRQLRHLRHIPGSVRVIHLGPRWNEKWVAWFRAAVVFLWQWKSFGALISPRIARVIFGIAQYMRQECPHVILTALPAATTGTLLARRIAGKATRVVISIRNSMLGMDARDRHSANVLFPEADGIVTVSRGLVDELTSQTSIPRERITAIYNPAFTPELESLAAATPEHPWLRQKELSVVLAAGRLAPQKDHPTLLRAFARMTRHPDMRLVILGEGVGRQSLEALIRELGIEQRVDMPGWVSNPFAFMSRARLFVLSSRWEGLPGVLIQAMACGCPVVSTDCPTGPREILEDSRWGTLVPVGDDAALAKAMAAVLEGRPDRDALRRRAAYFSVERAVEQYEKVLLR